MYLINANAQLAFDKLGDFYHTRHATSTFACSQLSLLQLWASKFQRFFFFFSHTHKKEENLDESTKFVLKECFHAFSDVTTWPHDSGIDNAPSPSLLFTDRALCLASSQAHMMMSYLSTWSWQRWSAEGLSSSSPGQASFLSDCQRSAISALKPSSDSPTPTDEVVNTKNNGFHGLQAKAEIFPWLETNCSL